MAAQPRITQGGAYALVSSDSTPRILQGGAYAATQTPADIQLTQGGAYAVAAGGVTQITQGGVYALVRVIPPDIKRIRAWGFSLDGHDFYVLRLGEDATLVYDLSTDQWSEWKDHNHNYWRAHVGMNWIGMAGTTHERSFGSQIVAGDDTEARMWVLDPDQGFDDEPDESDPTPFERIVTGGLPQRMREITPVGGVYLNISTGSPVLSGADVTLRTSDDGGNTWINHGTISVTIGTWDQEVAWRSLGYIRHPGRIFEFSDNGVAVRISGADMR